VTSLPNQASPRGANWLSDALLAASVVAFFVSLGLPAYRTGYNEMDNAHFGIEALILGPIGLITGQVAWLANPFLWGTWFVRKSALTRQTVAVAVIALLIAGAFPLGNNVAVGSAGETPFRVAPGYFVWLLSMVLTAVSALTYVKPQAHTPSNAI
jgi:hypothetical protein